jgi:hypothetical protein
MPMTYTFEFEAALWEHAGEKASWYLLSVPLEHGEEIRFVTSKYRTGFGSVKVNVTIGSSTWQTSLFPSAKTGSYVLLIKKAIRVAESISVGDTVKVCLQTTV